MQIDIESLSEIKKKINFEIPADKVAAEIDKAYEKIRKKAAVKGFRKGKVPRAHLEKHFSEMMEEDVLKTLVNDTYFKAIFEHKLNPVSYPEIESAELKIGESFKYSATVEILPEIRVKDFEGLEISKEKFVANDNVIESRLKQFQENMAQLKPIDEDRVAALGDFAVIDFKGFIDGVPFENGSAEDYLLELGSGSFIPGFEEQIVGMRSGDSGEVKVTFPDSYGKKDLAGKEAIFFITIKDLKVKEVPELDDEFAKELGEFDTLAELRSKIAEGYEKQENERIESDLRENLVKALIARNEFEVPSSLVENQLNIMIDSAKKRLAYQNLTLEMMGMNEDSYRNQFKSIAETRVKGSILLDVLAKQQELKVEESDLSKMYAQISEGSNQDVEKVINYYQSNAQARENLNAQILEDKAINFLLETAIITETTTAEK